MVKKISEEEARFFLACLKDKMKEGCLTQSKVCSGTGINNSILSRFINGMTSPSLESLIKISGFFHSTVDEFIAQGRMLAPVTDDEREISKIITCHLEIEIIENGIMLTVGRREKYGRLFITPTEFLSNDSLIHQLDRALSGELTKLREQVKSKKK
jgi:transcriptional regulator with XRE-family HTH domain